MVILLAVVGSSGSYAISQSGFLQVAMFAIFIFFIVGVIYNYFELNSIKKELEEIKNGCGGLLFVVSIIIGITLGYFAYKNKWKVTEFF